MGKISKRGNLGRDPSTDHILPPLTAFFFFFPLCFIFFLSLSHSLSSSSSSSSLFSLLSFLRMLKIQVSTPSPEASLQPSPSLADLSRNASVLSSSSSSSSISDLTQTPVLPRPRPLRTFSSPRTSNVRSRSPQSPTTPRGSRPPAYLARELGLTGSDDEDKVLELKPPPQSRAQSKSRNSSVNGRISADDFEFGRVLGEGSYSTVSAGSSHFRTANADERLPRKNRLC